MGAWQFFVRGSGWAWVLLVVGVLGGCAPLADDMRLTNAGAGALASGDPVTAEDRLRAALEINPDNGYALMTLGALYQRGGRDDEARALYADVAARFGPGENGGDGTANTALGVAATERAALAALARARLARLSGDAGTDRAMLSTSALKAVFGNLQRATRNLEALSARVSAAAPAPGQGMPPDQGTTAARPGKAPSAAKPLAPASEDTAITVVAAAPPKPRVRIHLASYRSADRVETGWKVVTTRYPKLLDGLGHAGVKVDLGPGMGIYYRLLAGPLPDEAKARELCRALKRRGAFCALIFD